MNDPSKYADHSVCLSPFALRVSISLSRALSCSLSLVRALSLSCARSLSLALFLLGIRLLARHLPSFLFLSNSGEQQEPHEMLETCAEHSSCSLYFYRRYCPLVCSVYACIIHTRAQTPKKELIGPAFFSM